MADSSNNGTDWSSIITSLIGAGGSLLSGALAPRRHPFTGSMAPQNIGNSLMGGLNDAQSGMANWINKGVNLPDATLTQAPAMHGGVLPMKIGQNPINLPNQTHFDMAHFSPMGPAPGGQAGVNTSDSGLLSDLAMILGGGAAGGALGSLLGKGNPTNSSGPGLSFGGGSAGGGGGAQGPSQGGPSYFPSGGALPSPFTPSDPGNPDNGPYLPPQDPGLAPQDPGNVEPGWGDVSQLPGGDPGFSGGGLPDLPPADGQPGSDIPGDSNGGSVGDHSSIMGLPGAFQFTQQRPQAGGGGADQAMKILKMLGGRING